MACHEPNEHAQMTAALANAQLQKVMLALLSFAGIGRRSYVYATLTPQIRAVRNDRSVLAPHAAEPQKKRLCAVLFAALCFVA
jgi:hypothetical protein